MTSKKEKDKGKGAKKPEKQTPAIEKSEESTEKSEVNEGTEKEEKKEEHKEEAPEKDTTKLPSVPLTVFCQLSGKKPDQIAGFRRYALTKKLKPMTVPQWREELVTFQNKPMR